MQTSEKQVEALTERRGAERTTMGLAGSATSIEGSSSVLIADLSSSGAKILGRFLPPIGKEIILRTEDPSLFGRVAWASKDHRGITFVQWRRTASGTDGDGLPMTIGNDGNPINSPSLFARMSEEIRSLRDRARQCRDLAKRARDEPMRSMLEKMARDG